MRERIEALAHRPIAATEKGFGVIAASQLVSAATLAAQHPPALGSDLIMPLLLLRDSALRHNARAMADWCTSAGVRLAPHGKTTMAPQLFARQLAAGAWGITAATISQAQVYRAFGVDRVLIANELTDRAGIRWLATELTADPEWECYAYVDSIAGVGLLDEALRAAAASRPLPVLVELGFPGGRTGCRSVAEALVVAAAVSQAPTLSLAGVAGFEGGLGTDASQSTLDAVAAFCAQLRTLTRQLPGEPAVSSRPPAPGELPPPGQPPPGQPPLGQPPPGQPVQAPPGGSWILSVGGSAYFDVVVRELTAAEEPAPTVVLRSGCYLTHDHGEYATIGPDARQRGPELIPALELWAPVLSCPEPGLALACAGRRDVSFDKGLPVPLRVRRPDGELLPADQMTVTRLDDQHAYLRLPAGAELAPGDLVCLGISHPCTTFDKWRVIPVVDDDYRVIDAVHTFF